jgi:predicted helicase
MQAHHQHLKERHLNYTYFFDSLTSFGAVQAQINTLPEETERGDAWEVFTYGYLATQCPQEIVPGTIWLEPYLPVWTDLGLPYGDKGSDGVWQNRESIHDLFQAKYKMYRNKLYWSVDDLAHIFGLCRKPKHAEKIRSRYIISNSYEVDDFTKDQDGYVGILGNTFDNLSAEQIGQITAFLRGEEPAKLERFPILPHQERALKDLVEYLKADRRTKYFSACGTGKTYVCLLVAERLGAKTVLVLLPNLVLMRQCVADWRAQKADFRYTCVCSDPKVVTEERHPFPVDTDPSEVLRFLDSPGEGMQVVFCTYQSSRVIRDAIALRNASALRPKFQFDLAICDEAHRTTGWEEDTTECKKVSYSLVLKDSNIPINYRLFPTATPRICINTKDDGKHVYSMDDQKGKIDYGPREHRYSFRAAITEGVICGP